MRRFVVLIGVALLTVIAHDSHAWDGIFFSNRRIRQADFDGTNLRDLVKGSGAWQIALDRQNEKMYWAGGFLGGASGIFRANLDGSHIEHVVAGGALFGVAVDAARGKVYWAGRDLRKIQRANLDGSNIEDVVVDLTQPRNLTLDLVHDMVYWTEGGDIRASIFGR